MKIAVIGAGGVGGYFGARLARGGHDVQFLARGRHLAAMRESGLRIDSEVERFTLERPQVTDDPRELRPADVMLVTTKLWDLEETARQLAPGLAPHTVVVPFQNGVDAVDILATSIPRAHIAAGVAYVSALIAEPGTIRHVGTMARLRVGALHPAQRDTLRALAEAGAACGCASDLDDDAQWMLWEKFISLNALSGITALTRQPVGVVRADRHMRATALASVRECAELARRSGVRVPHGFEDSRAQMLDALPAEMRASMAHDLLAGRRLEAPWLCGAVVRRAEVIGLDVPVNATIWAAMKPFVDGA